MDAGAVRGWLLKQPRATSLRVTDAEQRIHEIDCEGTTWASIAESVAALRPDIIEALDKSKKLIRAVRPAEMETPATPATPAATKTPSTDPETERFRIFAVELSGAYAQTRDFVQTAFDKLVDLVEAQNKEASARNREMENLMKLLRREWEDKLDAAAEAAEANSDPLTQIATAFAGGVNAGNDAKSNGKG